MNEWMNEWMNDCMNGSTLARSKSHVAQLLLSCFFLQWAGWSSAYFLNVAFKGIYQQISDLHDAKETILTLLFNLFVRMIISLTFLFLPSLPPFNDYFYTDPFFLLLPPPYFFPLFYTDYLKHIDFSQSFSVLVRIWVLEVGNVLVCHCCLAERTEIVLSSVLKGVSRVLKKWICIEQLMLDYLFYNALFS